MDHPYAAALSSFDADLNRWHVRVRKVEEPEPRSDLAVDDAAFPGFAFSQAARMSLASAGEHLRMARTAIRAGELYPTAHFTALRGAMIGSAQAVWMLTADSSKDRKERGFTMIAEMFRQMRLHYDQAGTSQLAPDERARLDEQRRWLDARQGYVATQPKRTRLILTDVIGEALDFVFADTLEEETVGHCGVKPAATATSSAGQ